MCKGSALSGRGEKSFKIYSRFRSALECEQTAAAMLSQPQILTDNFTEKVQSRSRHPEGLLTNTSFDQDAEHPDSCHGDSKGCIPSKTPHHKDAAADNVVDLSDITAVAGSDFTSLISSLASLSSSCSSKGSTPRAVNLPVPDRQQALSTSAEGAEHGKSYHGVLPCARATPATSKFVSLVTDMDRNWDEFCGCSTVCASSVHTSFNLSAGVFSL